MARAEVIYDIVVVCYLRHSSPHAPHVDSEYGCNPKSYETVHMRSMWTTMSNIADQCRHYPLYLARPHQPPRRFASAGRGRIIYRMSISICRGMS